MIASNAKTVLEKTVKKIVSVDANIEYKVRSENPTQFQATARIRGNNSQWEFDGTVCSSKQDAESSAAQAAVVHFMTKGTSKVEKQADHHGASPAVAKRDLPAASESSGIVSDNEHVAKSAKKSTSVSSSTVPPNTSPLVHAFSQIQMAPAAAEHWRQQIYGGVPLQDTVAVLKDMVDTVTPGLLNALVLAIQSDLKRTTTASAGQAAEPPISCREGSDAASCLPGLADESSYDDCQAPVNMGLEDWLKSLDNGRGTLLQYLPSISAEFDDLNQICCVWVGDNTRGPEAASVLGAARLCVSVDPVFWESSGVHKLEHKVLLARGIQALQA
eukprot:gnl/TRDRNA2_/TRDRNA2_175365_c1_seq2.p1 gnl/TRDRNA2_/TRDRNA2_175365_c1~~gnl/TRDRNA2_/TRDRNA2_175365_c1_seq2.p1  ORF type:complete len:330 (+),score=46.32 gnl/TRDRNA2_/TRDRNA2_175365_c1_seq2:45-1034(+)